MTKEETKQTVEEAAIEARMASAETLTTMVRTHHLMILNIYLMMKLQKPHL